MQQFLDVKNVLHNLGNERNQSDVSLGHRYIRVIYRKIYQH